MIRKIALLCLLSVVTCSLSLGQLSFGKKDKQAAPQTDSNGMPQFSDADKARMAEIAQRPDVQNAIDDAWNVRRNDDLRAAYALNQTEDIAISENPMSKIGYEKQFGRLYNNPMMQMYLNQIGQRLVPKDSSNLYTFRIILDPQPKAMSLTTGSIYISTGLLSMLDSEAQLSYILGHEVAHIEQRHQYNRVRNEILLNELNKEKEAKAEHTKAMISAGSALAGGLIGGLAKGAGGILAGAAIAGVGGYIASNYLVHSGVQEVDWSVEEENEADQLGAQYMLQQNYDVREVPRLYATLDRIVSKDSRVGLSFLGNPKRVKERRGHIQELINGSLRDQIAKLSKGDGLVGSHGNFPILLAAAKRDNAIIAMQSDLFAEAQANLEDALAQRSNDPSVHYYLSRILFLTARTPDDKRMAVSHIEDALRLDAQRGAIPALHLEMAISLLMQDNPANKDQAIKELKSYIALYQRDNAGALPSNMPAIIDYFNLVGEAGWYLPPDWYPMTQMMNTSSTTAIAPATVVRKAEYAGGQDTIQVDTSNPATVPAAKARAVSVKK